MSRIPVLKTYKIYIGGQFPRSESGRFYEVNDQSGSHIANVCLCSRKDFRNAVVAASNAQSSWAEKTAYNRSQILYRIAEILEGRKSQFIEELKLTGFSEKSAILETETAIDRLIYFAGWADKYQQLFSSVNPVSGSFFNFSVLEPMGVVSVIAPNNSPLVGLVSLIASLIAGGNTCIVLAAEEHPFAAISFAEVLNSSDVPAGVVNILTGNTKELLEHFVSHIDVKAICFGRNDEFEIKKITELASVSVKRVILMNDVADWNSNEFENPYAIKNFQEVKTTWHPIESIGISGAKY